MDGHKTKAAPSLERGLTIIEVLANSQRGQNLSELTRSLHLPKSSIHRLLLTLELRGYLYRNEQTGRYNFGLKLFNLASMALGRTKLREQAGPVLHALMQKTGLTIHMAILEQNQAFLIEKIEPPGLPRLGTWIGRSMDLHCTGVGKALLAHLREEEIQRLIRNGLPRYNDNTIVSAKKLKEELARIRQVGYALDDEEETIGLRCIGTPILDSESKAVAAISIAGTTAQINPDNISSLALKLRQSSSEISRRLLRSPEELIFSTH